MLTQAALSLEHAGADVILLCTNTMHKMAPFNTPYLKTPFLHIAEATANTLKKTASKKHFYSEPNSRCKKAFTKIFYISTVLTY